MVTCPHCQETYDDSQSLPTACLTCGNVLITAPAQVSAPTPTQSAPVTVSTDSQQELILEVHTSEGVMQRSLLFSAPDQVFTLGRIGQDGIPDIDLTGLTPVVSRQHGRFSHKGRFWFEDHSVNGTWIDGKRVHQKKVALKQGAELVFGDVKIIVHKAAV